MTAPIASPRLYARVSSYNQLVGKPTVVVLPVEQTDGTTLAFKAHAKAVAVGDPATARKELLTVIAAYPAAATGTCVVSTLASIPAK